MTALTIFPISLWYPPENTYDNWKLVAECGFNIVPFQSPSVAEGLRVLDWLREFGIKGMVQDPRVGPRLPDQPAWQDTVRQVVADYGKHPALWGYFMADEPRFAGIEQLASCRKPFKWLIKTISHTVTCCRLPAIHVGSVRLIIAPM